MELLRQDGRLEQLKEWPPELALKFERMLMEHHHIFSLDKNEIGCMDMAEHIIELMDDAPFKEWFWQIAPPLLEEVGQSDCPSHPGVTPSSLYEKKTELSGSVSIFGG